MDDLQINEQFIEFANLLPEMWQKHTKQYGDDMYFYELNPDEIEARIRNGNSIVDPDKLELNERFLKDAFDDYLSLIKEVEGIEHEITILERRFSSHIHELSDLALSLLRRDNEYFKNHEKQTDIGADVLLFFAENLVRPVVLKIAKEAGKYINYETWMKNFCPVCHWSPMIGKIREDDGRRLLYCALCGTEWQFKRLKCPWCLNEDHKKLGFLLINGEKKWRLDVCEKCKGYIKTINERMNGKKYATKISIEDLYKLEIESKYLENYAIDNGYQRRIN